MQTLYPNYFYDKSLTYYYEYIFNKYVQIGSVHRALYMPDELNLSIGAGEKRNQSRRLTSSFFMSSSMSR